MVYKVCKGGVRSGNTLRGLHTLRTRRYAGQACIIGQSNLSLKQVSCLLEESTDDAIVSNTLKNTDVLLSLNKKQRWKLPATVNNMIRAGFFANSEAMVSVLERHKLKRRANCIGFACNKKIKSGGQSTQATGHSESLHGQKKYFSFNSDCLDMDVEVSRRQWKKKMAEEVKKLKRENKRNEKKDKHTDMKTVEVLTIQGHVNRNVKYKNAPPSTKPQYKLEVIYPCPQSCSLTFNPKYTDVTMTQNDVGEMEVRTKANNSKKAHKKRRKRFNVADLRELHPDSTWCDEDLEEMWRQVYDETSLDSWSDDRLCYTDTSTLSCPSEKNLREDGAGASTLQWTNDLSDSLFASLVDQAEQARVQWSRMGTRERRRRKSGRYDENSEPKPKSTSLYFVKSNPDDDDQKYFVAKNNQTNAFHEKQGSIKSTPVQAKLAESREELILPSVPVILSSTEVSPRNLVRRFGNLYTEADCQPRRFCINITDDVASLLSIYRSSQAVSIYTTFLIFTSKGVYDKGMETYDVALNCSGYMGSEHVTYSMPNGLTTLDEIVNSFVGNLLDLKEIGLLNFSDQILLNNSSVFATFHETMMEKMNIHVDNFFISNELFRKSQAGPLQNKTDNYEDEFSQSLMQLAVHSETDVFCEICYESINPTQIDASPGTQLNACRHIFCDTCWKTHLRTRLREGATHLTCPGYQCDAELTTPILLSLLHVTEVAQIMRRICEEEVETSPLAKWCPNPTCGRAIRLRTKVPDSGEASQEPDLNVCLNVTCACGESLCFSCLSPAHWPAGCDQAQDYQGKVSTLKPIKDTAEDDVSETTPAVPAKPKHVPAPTLEVEGRLCPRCNRFIEKNGGCPHMTCKCGHAFCWRCMAVWNGHGAHCKKDPAVLEKFTRRVKIRHLNAMPDENIMEDLQNKKEQPLSKPASRRQKATMYQRALQQRMLEGAKVSWCKATDALVAKICKTAGRDLLFKRKVLLQCGIPESQIPGLPSADDALEDCDLARFPVADDVIRYLRSCSKARLAISHVVEYTFVLLQDCPASTDKRRAFRIASDLSAYCSFALSVLEAGGNQDPYTALKRLSNIQTWLDRALEALMVTVHRLKH